MFTIILESLDDIVVVIITLYLCFGPCTAFYFYVLLTNDYSAVLFYALCAILCLGNFLHVQALHPKGGVSTSGIAVELARKAIPLVETQSSSWSVSLYMIFCFLSSGDGKAI